MVASVGHVNGDHRHDRPATDCPALLVRDTRTDTLSGEQAGAMATRRPRARLVELPTGRTVHETAPEGSGCAVREFLDSL